jgi:flavin reductase (DIM6/NTAB) family NADH-FMN oxidoreductase RutF
MSVPATTLSDTIDPHHTCDCVYTQVHESTDRDVYRKAMRSVAGTVAIVTTDGPRGRIGATVTAFCSLSADPPTLLTCLRSGSRIAQAVEANGLFALNIVAEDACMTARIFSGEFDSTKPDRFDGIRLIEKHGLAPALYDALCFTCHVIRREQQDSHTIFIGRVHDIQFKELTPLIYHDGSYCCVRPSSFPVTDAK